VGGAFQLRRLEIEQAEKYEGETSLLSQQYEQFKKSTVLLFVARRRFCSDWHWLLEPIAKKVLSDSIVRINLGMNTVGSSSIEKSSLEIKSPLSQNSLKGKDQFFKSCHLKRSSCDQNETLESDDFLVIWLYFFYRTYEKNGLLKLPTTDLL